MCAILSNHYNFLTEKTIVEHYLDSQGLPYQNFTAIDRVRGQAKVYTRTVAIKAISKEGIRCAYFKRELKYRIVPLDTPTSSPLKTNEQPGAQRHKPENEMKDNF